MDTFEVGDTVEVLNSIDEGHPPGTIGTVVKINTNNYSVKRDGIGITFLQNALNLKFISRPEIPIDNLIDGEYYHCYDETGFIIFKFLSRIKTDKDRLNSYYFLSTMNNYSFESSGEFIINQKIWYTKRKGRKATQIEKNWLDYCVLQNKFIELSEFTQMDAYSGLDDEDEIQKEIETLKSFKIKYTSVDGNVKTETVEENILSDAISKIPDFQTMHYYIEE